MESGGTVGSGGSGSGSVGADTGTTLGSTEARTLDAVGIGAGTIVGRSGAAVFGATVAGVALAAGVVVWDPVCGSGSRVASEETVAVARAGERGCERVRLERATLGDKVADERRSTSAC